MIDDAKKVAVFGGDGCRDARDEVVQLAAKLKAPVGYTFRGKQWLEHDNSNAVGMTGLLGYGGTYNAIHDADLLLLLGTDFPFSEFLPGNGVKKVQIDKNPKHIGRRTAVDFGLVGDIKATADELLNRVSEKTDSRFLGKHLAETSNLFTTSYSTMLRRGPGSSPSDRNFWLRRSAIWLPTTQCFSPTQARHASGWPGTSHAARIAGFSVRFHGLQWPMPLPMHSGHNWHIRVDKRSLCVGTVDSRCSPWAIY